VGGKVAELRYLPYGSNRYSSGTTPTAYKFTGQRLDDSTGLYYYGARYYDAALGRFISPDAFVPSPGNPQSLNRYSYANNNPLLYTDPSGHFVLLATAAIGALGGAAIGAVMAAGPQIIHNIQTGQPLTANIDPSTVAKAAAVGAATGLVAGATLGIGTAVLGTGFGAMVASGAVSGAVAGQAGRATENVLSGQEVTAGLGNPADIATEAVVGGALAGVGYGVGRLVRPAAAEAAGRNVPNPNGRLGRPAHQAKVAQVADDIVARGLEPKTEFHVKTPGGAKVSRFADVAALDSSGQPVEFHQVGQLKTNGFPAAREMRAIFDILRYGDHPDVPLWFHEF
jgi:RHS repeat-associated protein